MIFCLFDFFKFIGNLLMLMFFINHFARGAKLPSKSKKLASSIANVPLTFGSDFKIPTRDKIWKLEEINVHPLDKKISFDEESHTYEFEGKPLSLSVTELVGNYFSKFDATKTAKTMINGRNWPREGYIHENGEPFTEEEILESWELNGEDARNRGSWMHYNIERLLNGLESNIDIPELQQYLDFQQHRMLPFGVQPFRTEWRIAAPEFNLAGSVDFVGVLPDGTYSIMDWKRSKRLPNSSKNSYGRKGKIPIKHLSDTDETKYSLQLNLYKYILTNYYDLDVSSMVIASFHPELDDFYSFEVPNYQKEIKDILNHSLSGISNSRSWTKVVD